MLIFIRPSTDLDTDDPVLAKWRHDNCPYLKRQLGQAAWPLVSTSMYAKNTYGYKTYAFSLLRRFAHHLFSKTFEYLQLHSLAAEYPEQPTPEQQVY